MTDTGFARPTLAELIARISGDLNTRLPGHDSLVRRSVLWVLARVVAGAVHLLYGFAAWIARQILPDRADEAVLRRHAAIWGLAPLSATWAYGRVTFTGTPATLIPAGSILQRDDEREYRTILNATIGGGGTVSARVQAMASGADGNADVGTILTLATPIAGVTSAATVNASPDDLAHGTDTEGVDSLRARLLAYIAERPQGGAVADYEAWARSVYAGVRVFVAPLEAGPGTVVVRFILPPPLVGIDVIPDAGTVADVQAYLDVVAPVTAAVTVYAPAGKPIAMSIHVAPDTAAIRAAVTAELDDLFAREAAPSGTIPNSHIREAIARAEGEVSHTLGAVGGGAGTADVSQAFNEIAYLGVVTWY
jgi:uncharacterized phage protein gp47/JayE